MVRENEVETHAHAEIPFYRGRTETLLFRKDLKTTLPKSWVPSGFDLRQALSQGDWELLETGGSSGDRVRVLREKGATRGVGRRVLAALGVDEGAKTASLTVPKKGLGPCHAGDPTFEEKTEGEHLHLNTHPDPTYWSPDDVRRMLSELVRHETNVLFADPNYLALLLQRARALGERPLSIPGVVLTHALATQASVRAIRSMFEGALWEAYVTQELGLVGVSEYGIPLRPVENLALSALGTGRFQLLVATTLDRTMMPLVRYVVGDVVSGDPSRGFLCEGRVDDVVRTSNALVTPRDIDRAIGAPDGLLSYQLRQGDEVECDFLLADGGDEHRVAQHLCDVLPFRVTPRKVQALAMDSGGRFRNVRRAVPLSLSEIFPDTFLESP